MKNSEDWKMFVKFLKANGAYQQFNDNVHGMNPPGLWGKLMTMGGCAMMSSAFKFDQAPEGFYYWTALDKKWQDTLKRARG